MEGLVYLGKYSLAPAKARRRRGMSGKRKFDRSNTFALLSLGGNKTARRTFLAVRKIFLLLIRLRANRQDPPLS